MARRNNLQEAYIALTLEIFKCGLDFTDHNDQQSEIQKCANLKQKRIREHNSRLQILTIVVEY